MFNDPQITIHGNLTDDPELRFTPNGQAVCELIVVQNSRVKADGEWKDGQPSFFHVTVWRKQAENCAASLSRGSTVLVHGRMRTNKWKDKESGENRYRQYVEADVVAHSLMFHAVSVRKAVRSSTETYDGEWENMNEEQLSVSPSS